VIRAGKTQTAGVILPAKADMAGVILPAQPTWPA
jgi:hypothetical protein